MPKQIGISILCIILSIVINFINAAVTDLAWLLSLKDNPDQLLAFLAVSFDLLLVAFSLILGIALTIKKDKKDRLFWPMVSIFIGFLFLLALQVSPNVFTNINPNWLRIYIPDLVGFILIGYIAGAATEG